MADDSDLLPCPHCGSQAKSYHRPDDTGWCNTDWICCDAGDDGISPDCGAQTCLHESRAQAVAAWNRRVDSPIVAQQQGGDELDQALAKHGPRYVLTNARRLLARKHKKDANWVLAMNIYSLGSTYARWLCQRYGLDPDATTT